MAGPEGVKIIIVFDFSSWKAVILKRGSIDNDWKPTDRVQTCDGVQLCTRTADSLISDRTGFVSARTVKWIGDALASFFLVTSIRKLCSALFGKHSVPFVHVF